MSLQCTVLSTRSLTGGVQHRTPTGAGESTGTPKEPPRAKRASRRSVTGGGRFLFEKREQRPLDNPETAFFQGLIELQYGQKVERKLRTLSQQVPWAHGWPENKQAFWDAEAFMWSRKIEKETRALIQHELKFLTTGKNLDLGCGAYSYISSVGFDLSPQMLKLNDSCYEKVRGDVEQKLPFKDKSFDSVTAIFVLNYVQNYQQLLQEIKRVLKPKGRFTMVLSATKIKEWQRQKEVNHFEGKRWKRMVEQEGFRVKLYQKEGLWFLRSVIENIKKR